MIWNIIKKFFKMKKDIEKPKYSYFELLKEKDIEKLQDILIKNNYQIKKDGIYGPKTKTCHVELLDKMFDVFCRDKNWKYTGQALWKSRIRTNLIPKDVIWHWTSSGRTAESLGNLWGGETRGASSHVGVDESGIWWYAPPHRATWHAGVFNENSLGIDICVPPINDTDGIKRARSRGIYDGPTDADDNYQKLHPKVLENIKQLTDELDKHIELKYMDHAHVDPSRKIDCIPWRVQLKKIGVYDV